MSKLMDVFKKYKIEPEKSYTVEDNPVIEQLIRLGYLRLDYLNGVIPRKPSIETNSSNQ